MTDIYIGPDQTKMAQMLARKTCLRWERFGCNGRGRSVYSIVKKERGLRGNKQGVYTQYCGLVEKAKGEL